MIISKNHLQAISNYSEVNVQNNQIQFSYIEMEVQDSEYKRKVQSINRGLAIDAVLDNKEEEYKTRDTSYSETFENEENISSISPKVKTITLTNPIKYTSLNDIFDKAISELEILTKNSMSGQNLDLSLTFDINLSDYENSQQNSRKLISRILMTSTRIAMNSRIGPANSAIVGREVYQLLLISNGFTNQVSGTGPIVGTVGGLSIIYSEKISPNKVILLKSGTKADNGFNVVNNTLNNTFYIKETPSWRNFVNWFNII